MISSVDPFALKERVLEPVLMVVSSGRSMHHSITVKFTFKQHASAILQCPITKHNGFQYR